MEHRECPVPRAVSCNEAGLFLETASHRVPACEVLLMLHQDQAGFGAPGRWSLSSAVPALACDFLWGFSYSVMSIGLWLQIRVTMPFSSLMKGSKRWDGGFMGPSPQQKGGHPAAGECDNKGPRLLQATFLIAW